MKVSQIIGKKVLDSNANIVGKIHEIDIDLKEKCVKTLILNSAEISLKRVNIEVNPNLISEVGDYVLLNTSKDEIMKSQPSKNKPDAEVVNPSELEDN